jgi:predicted nucleotidyltransferase
LIFSSQFDILFSKLRPFLNFQWSKKGAMDKRDRNLIKEFKKRLPPDVISHIRKVIAFGSRVRGQWEEDSDLDLLILADRKTNELESKIEDIAYQIMWDHDFKPIISIKLFTEASYRNSLEEGFSFYKNIEREGVSL